MDNKEFITYLKENEIPFERGKNSITVLGGSIYFRSLTTLPAGVKFNNKGSIYFRSLTTLPAGVKFNNEGYVDFRSITTISKGVKFNNRGDVHLDSLATLQAGVEFNNERYVYFNSLTTLQAGVKFNNEGSIFFRSLTTISKGAEFNNGGYIYFRSLTTLSKGVEFNNKGTVYLPSLASPKQKYRGKKVKLIDVDFYTMLVTSEKTQGDYSVCKAKYFGGGDIGKLRSCFLASKDNVWAHGNTVKSAIEDVQFKLMEQSDKQDVIHKIKSSKIVTVNDFRALTGACREGMRQHLSSLGIDMDSVESLPINDAIKAMKGSSFGDAFVSQMGDVS